MEKLVKKCHNFFSMSCKNMLGYKVSSPPNLTLSASLKYAADCPLLSVVATLPVPDVMTRYDVNTIQQDFCSATPDADIWRRLVKLSLPSEEHLEIETASRI